MKTCSPGQDLAAQNIQRGCEHGIPSYRHYQKFCTGLFGVPSEFTSLDTEVYLKDLYRASGFADGIDLWVGRLAEKRIEGSNLGPTFACIIGKTFANICDGDRLFWENPGVFTENQRYALGNVRFSKVICENADDITTIIPRAFATGQKQQDCKSLPSLDLNLWKDGSCAP